MSLMYDALRTLEGAQGAAPAMRGRARVDARVVGGGVVALVVVASGVWWAAGPRNADVSQVADAQPAHAARAEVRSAPRDRDEVEADGTPLDATDPVATTPPASIDENVPARRPRENGSPAAPQPAPTLASAQANSVLAAEVVTVQSDMVTPPGKKAATVNGEPASAGMADANQVTASKASADKTHREPASAVEIAASTSATPTPPPNSQAREADPSTVQRAVADLDQAMRARDLEAARARLGSLAALLPPDSLTLLRMRTWVAHEGGDTDTALTGYREIARRLPGDRAATINLAALEAQQGDVAAARERLQALRAQAGSSPELDAAMARVGGAP